MDGLMDVETDTWTAAKPSTWCGVPAEFRKMLPLAPCTLQLPSPRKKNRTMAAITTLVTTNRSTSSPSSIARSFEGSLRFASVALRRRKLSKSFLSRQPFRAMGSSASSQRPDSAQDAGNADYSSISDDEWKRRLSKEQYYIARQKGTERAFTGEYWNTKTPGTYHCICCDTPLFESTTKFDSGTGWPSYYQPIGNNVKSKLDLSIIFMPREEVLCAACDAHLGHIFDDGPPPTGKRYCINSASLKLKPRE